MYLEIPGRQVQLAALQALYSLLRYAMHACTQRDMVRRFALDDTQQNLAGHALQGAAYSGIEIHGSMQ